MKKMIFFVVLFCSTIGFSQQQNATFTTNPTFFEENDEIVLTVSDIDPGLWGVTDIYLWAWYYDTDGNPAGDSPTNGTWENSNESQKFTPADYKISGNKLIVYNKVVKNPVAVRFGFSDVSMSNLFNSKGLPVSPFRTDNW